MSMNKEDFISLPYGNSEAFQKIKAGDLIKIKGFGIQVVTRDPYQNKNGEWELLTREAVVSSANEIYWRQSPKNKAKYGDEFVLAYKGWQNSEFCNDEVPARIMAQVLTDPEIKTWDVFERLVKEYEDGSEEVRKTIDMVLHSLTGNDLPGIFEKILDDQKETDIDLD